MRRLYIGIDNGTSGAIAALTPEGKVWRVEPMPATEADLLQLLQIMRHAPDGAVAVLEHAQAFPKMGTSSAFNYGRGYGAAIMALTAAEIPFDIVVPRKWQQGLGCLSKGDKNVTKRRAQQLFPGVTVTHAIADALLIAEFCRRVRGQHGTETGQGSKTESGRQRAIRRRVARARQSIEDRNLEEREEQIAAERTVEAIAALAGPAGHGAGPRQGPRQPLRGHQRRAHGKERG